MDFQRSHRAGRGAHERVLFIEAGQVMCPRRGMVDLEACWVCPAYLGMSGDRTEGLVCSTRPRVLPFAGWAAVH